MLNIVRVYVIVALAAICTAGPAKLRNFPPARQEPQPVLETPKPTPYPAAGFRPEQSFDLPTEQQVQLDDDQQQQLPAEDQPKVNFKPALTYGAPVTAFETPADTYGPPLVEEEYTNTDDTNQLQLQDEADQAEDDDQQFINFESNEENQKVIPFGLLQLPVEFFPRKSANLKTIYIGQIW